MSIYERLELERIEARDARLRAERERNELAAMRHECASLRLDLALIKLRRALKLKYRPDQPRVPAGNPDGGQWTSEGGGEGTSGGETVDVDVTGSTERPPGRFAPGRHHFVPQSVYKRLPLPSETRRIFDEATIAPLQAGPHRWSQDHRIYNRVVGERLQHFMDERGIRAEQMTPDQARQFVNEVRHSRDPRIRGFNLRIYRREMLYWIRRAPRSD